MDQLTAVRQWSQETGVLSVEKDRPFYYYCKRVIDVVLASVVLLFLTPVMVVIAILIKLDSPGPIFFVQERVGSRRKTTRGRVSWVVENFYVYKFRSMVQDADPMLHKAHVKAYVNGQLKGVDPEKGDFKLKFKLKADPRVTRIGKFLRKTSLDELPQLFNVLKGEMSLVGPRPVPTYEVAEYQEWHYKRLTALPGISGWWQVKGRCQVYFDEMIKMDIEYVHRQSLWLDFKIMIMTIPAVLSGRGAG